MRKFILTSPKFTGQIEVIYDADEILCIDFRNGSLSWKQKDYFLSTAARRVSLLESFAKDNNFSCVESDVTVTFEMFWDKYGMKVDRKRALAIWNKLPQAKQVAAYFGIDKYDHYLRRTDWRNKCEPKTYLINERWENQWK